MKYETPQETGRQLDQQTSKKSRVIGLAGKSAMRRIMESRMEGIGVDGENRDIEVKLRPGAAERLAEIAAERNRQRKKASARAILHHYIKDI